MITSTDEINLQRLLIICENKLKNEQVDIWTGSEKRKYASYINYLEFLQSRIQRQANAKSYEERIASLRQTFSQYHTQTDVEKGVKETRMTKKLFLDQLQTLYNPDPAWLTALKQQKDTINENNDAIDSNDDTIKEKEMKDETKYDQKLESVNDILEGWDESEESILLNDLNTKDNTQELKDNLHTYNNNTTNNEKEQDVRKRNVTNMTREEETTNIEHVLQHHRQLHDEMTSDLGKMAQQLKMNTQLFGDILNKDDQILRDAQKMVENNLDKMKTEGKRLDKHYSKAWGTTCMNLGVVLFVCIMFILVFFTIKLGPKV
ncbi:vesicle transport protein [Cunninghamella echinulata]|nr:vesicle transport protein [Cunninghamella echinulata]